MTLMNPKQAMNIKDKTIFDFCTDPAILEDIAIVDKDQYLQHIVENPVENAFDLLEYADRMNDPELRELVLKEYADILNAYFDE